MPAKPLKRATSLTLDRDLLTEARGLGLNISRAAEEGVRAAIRAEKQRQWREDNAAAVQNYNDRVAAGTLGRLPGQTAAAE